MGQATRESPLQGIGGNYIVLQCYGNKGIFHECAFALLSLSRLYQAGKLPVSEIWIYTDDHTWFASFKDCSLPLRYRKLDEATINKWKGDINFVHRVKIEVLKDLVKDKTGNILYLDCDVVFTTPIEEVFNNIGASQLYMHVREGKVSDRSNSIFAKLDTYLRKNVPLKINGTPIHDVAMWNAGVLGFNTEHKHILDEVLAFTDNEYTRFPKHVIEQFAFSVYFQQAGNVKQAAPYLIHYWNLKEVRLLLASFFVHFKTKSWSELVHYSQLIQMPVLIQEKGNFYSNRSIGKSLQKVHWQPTIPDWNELSKQL